jgi:hypothetical protein
MHAIVNPDKAAWFRRIQRAYSKKYSTPLPVVQDLPAEEVLQAYYEGAFEEMDDEEREEYIDFLTETDEQRAEREKNESDEEKRDDDFVEALTKEVEQDVAAGRKGRVQRKRKRRRAPDAKPTELEGGQDEPLINMQFGEGGNLIDEDLSDQNSSNSAGSNGCRKTNT